MGLLALNFSAFTGTDFWIGVGVLAGIYGIFALGLQLNAGFTGIFNFGQAGFMAIGAYAAGILVVKGGLPWYEALPAAAAAAIAAGLLLGLPSLRLRADYLAIATIAFSEVIRYIAQNARSLTGGNEGLLGYDNAWSRASDWLSRNLHLGSNFLVPLLLVTWVSFVILIVGLRLLTDSPWGRVLRAIREDEDAARSLGKNTFVYKLQSLALAALIGAFAGWLLALDLSFLSPDEFMPVFTFIGYTLLILGGMASYVGVAFGTVILWTVLEGTRYIGLPNPPFSDERIAALRFMIVGAVLILLMAFRPQGVLGKREEMILGD